MSSHLEQPDDVHEADDWEDPLPPTLRWTLNRTAHAVVGGTVRRQPDYPYPCQEDGATFPCVDLDGRTFRPGRMATLTLHRVRGRDLINEQGTVNQELCRHHYGTETVNERGRMAPVMFSLPNNANLAGCGLDNVFASVGFYTIGDITERPAEDLLSLCSPGRECGVVELQLPEWIEGMFDSHPILCGDPI